MATALETQLLYITYFGRPADPAGLAYWTTGPQASLPLDEVADFFAADVEFAQTTAGKTTEQIINSFYVNAFGRQADPAGLEFWTAKVNNGEISIQDVGLFIAQGALVQPPGSPDRVALESKQAASQAWTGLVAADTQATLEFAGPLAATFGVAFLVPVVSAATIPSEAETQAAIDGLPPVGTVGLLASSASQIDEGGTVTFTITTIPDLAGQTLTYQLSGVQAADVAGGQLSGTVLVTNTGVASISVTIINDNLVELDEVLTISFPSNIITANPLGGDSVIINDTTVPNLQVQASAASVNEGSSLTFTISSTNLPAGTEVFYDLSGTGLTSADVNNAPLFGTVVLNANGQAQVTFNVSADLSFEGAESVTFVATSGTASAQASSVINDTSVPPVPTLQVQASAASVNEGSPLTFTISSTNLPAGTEVFYDLSGTGLTSADVNNAPLFGTVVLNANGQAQVTFNVSADLSFEGAESVTFVATSGTLSAQASSVINDTSVPPTQAILTTNQDISGLNIFAPVSGDFTYFANEQTLGQNDQLSGAPGSTANITLSVGTEGSFDLTNFSTSGIETLFLRPSGDGLGNTGEVDLQDATGLRNINVEQSALGSVRFNDIQSAAGFTTRVTDSFSDFEYNFDANALTGFTSVSAIISETPIDANFGFAVGLDFTQGPVSDDAAIEALNLTSTGLNLLNVVDVLSVGEALETLTINGDTSLDITTDLGLGVNGNSRISLINATALAANLTLTYTSSLGDSPNNNNNPDVRVFGAEGSNALFLGSTAVNPTDFWVVTQNSDDIVFTVGGADTINVGEGDNLVFAGNGQNTVTSGAGDDTVITGTGNDLVTAGAGDNIISTDSGNDSIVTLGGNDLIFAGQGNDSVQAGSGNNEVFGDDFGQGAGNDTIVTGSGNDFISGDAFDGNASGAGNDSVISGEGEDTVFAGSGSNTVDSGAGDDIVVLGQTITVELPQPVGFVFGVPIGDGFANTVTLGAGDDLLRIDTDSLTVLDSINGGIGIDTIELYNGGTLLLSETLRTRQIEALDLAGLGDYNVTLSDELVRSSDELSASGSRVFSVFTSSTLFPSDSAEKVTLDLSFLTPVDAQANLLSIRYFGQADTDLERVIIRDGLINDQTTLAFGEAAFDEDETFADVLQIIDSVDVTSDDLTNITGLEVIELTSSVNGPQTFTIQLPGLADFNDLVGDSTDTLIIRATPSLNGAVSTLFLEIDSAAVAARVVVEQTANLNVVFTGAFAASVVTSLIYTNSADRLPAGAVTPGVPPFIPDGATVIAFQASDVQAFDFVNANEVGLDETIEFRFAVSNPALSLEQQLDFTQIAGIDLFKFVPAAVNQAVSFNTLGFFLNPGFATGLDSIETSGGSDRLINIERSIAVITGAGDDTVSGFGFAGLFADLGTGNDSFLGAAGDDTVIGGIGNDTISTDGGTDSVLAGEGNDSVLGGTGADTIDGGTGDNIIDAGTGADSVIAGVGNDSILGGTGDDTINAGNGTNTVLAGLGADSVVTGTGADSISTAAALEVENDTVVSGAGADTVLVGLGDDSVDAGADNDLIVLAASTLALQSGGFVQTDIPGGFSVGDRINGGTGDDTLVFSLADNAGPGNVVTTISGTQVQNIEQLNVGVGDFNTLILDTSLRPLPTGGTLRVNVDGDVVPNGNGQNFILDATSFVQGQAVNVFTTGLDVSSTYNLGAGNDTFTNFPGDDSDNLTVAGNGGSDTINLDIGATEVVRYNTGNDGGTGGTGTGGDLITGYAAAEDSIDITGGLLTDIGGLLSNQVTNAQLTLGGLSTTGNAGNNLSGRNILNLTGPARSLTDAQLSDASAVAGNINGVGVIGNGLALGDLVGLITFVDAVTNQALIVQQGQTNTALYLYTESSFDFANPQAYTVEASELRQLGVFTGTLFTGTELV